MIQRKLDFRDAPTAAVTVFAMIDTLHERARDLDKEGVHGMFQMLTQAIAGISRLLRRRRAEITRVTLGAQFPPERWKDMGPVQILNELVELAAVDKSMIDLKKEKIQGARSADQKKLSAEAKRMTRNLRNTVRASKDWILKHWPENWTEKEERDYSEYLP